MVGGNLTAENLQIIAKVAEKYGDGHVHLTSRQSVEIPFIKLDDVEEVKEVLATGDVSRGVWTACPYDYSLSGIGGMP